MLYPKPDRSNFIPNFRKTEEHPALDIGWDEGRLSDGRPYRVECWAEDQATSLTYFFSTAGLETLNDVQCVELLEREGLVRWLTGFRSASAMPFTDAAGNSMWSVNLVVGDDETVYIEDRNALRPYGVPSAAG
jgi:hypothetical protein